MPGSTTNYGWVYALGGDPRRDFPAVVNQPTTEAIDAELWRVEESTTAPRAAQTRTSTDAFPSGSMSSLGMTATITTAPAGIYLTSWRLILSAASATSGNLRVLVDGVNVTGDAVCDLNTERRHVSGVHVVAHSSGGSLTISPQFQTGSATGTIHEDSYISVTRIGSAV